MANPWVSGARPRTLPAAIVPVVVGTAVASADGRAVWWRAALALVVALAIQVGTNYANDYSDGIRGTDEVRAGPVRLVAAGLRSPAAVKRAALLAYAVAAGFGLALAAVTSWWLVLVGAACLLAGWLYTGGPRPYGYFGLGEVFVFVFFGVVATTGTAFVQTERVTGRALVASIGVGALAVALLVVNNLRDIPTDAVAGKRTLAVRLGDANTRVLYLVCLVVPFVVAVVLGAWPALLAAAPAAIALVPVAKGGRGRDLIPVLARTGRTQLAYGLLLALGMVRW